MSADADVPTRDIRRDDLTGRLFEGLGPGPQAGILVLHGAGGGGGYEQTYARYLAQHGYTVFCVEYFDAPGTPDALAQVPLSYFNRAITWLGEQPTVAADPVGVIGFSRGGEAALLVGAYCDNVGVVTGYVPSGYVFPAPTWMPGVEAEQAAWTWNDEPIPYLPVADVVNTEPDHTALTDVLPADEEPASTSAVEAATADELADATIEVERIDGPVLLISGGADEIWPSTDLAAVAIDRLRTHDHPWPSDHLIYPAAGHAIRVPYQVPQGADPGAEHQFGGTHAANAYASADAWPEVLDYLQVGLQNRSEANESQ